MKWANLRSFGSILFTVVIILFTSNAFAQDFDVVDLREGWQSEDFGTLPFKSAAIAFDSENNLYTNNLRKDFISEDYIILTYNAPNYNFDDPAIYVIFDKTFEVISGLNFDNKGNLFVSEVISEFNYIGYDYPDAGQISKIDRRNKTVSDPIEFQFFRPTGIAAIGSKIVYFSGRKWSDPYWGNIYKISNFDKYKSNNEPTIAIEGEVWTAIAIDRWGTIFGASRWDTGWSLYAQNPYTGDLEWIARFNKLIEELSFGADGNLYALETTDTDETEIIKLIPPNIVINGCDTKIIDWLIDGVSKISDYLDDCSEDGLHGEYMNCIARSANQLMRDGYISAKQMATIVTCAAKTDTF